MPTDLAAKLRQLQPAGAPRAARGRADVETVVAGRYVETPAGSCFVAERRYPATHPHGVWPLDGVHGLTAAARRVLARTAGDERFEPRAALYLDTETTGLAGGTGTYAFLVGVGYFEGDAFAIQQYFMRHPGEEPALLHTVGELMARFPFWVTFNGKGFDVPLLATRFQHVQRRPLAPPAAHLDLLHLARRLWRAHLPSCALSVLERSRLGVQRADDVPSWAIPGLYFDYVRRGAVQPLGGVFAHNADDVLSMVSLVALVGHVFAAPERHAGQLDPGAVIRLFSQARLHAEAAEWCRAALPALPASEQGRVRWELARLHRRAGLREAAVEQWRSLAQGPGPWAAAAYEELARHYEQHARDYEAARQATQAAMAALALQPLPEAAQRRARLERRLGRLWFRSRLAESAAPPSSGQG